MFFDNQSRQRCLVKAGISKASPAVAATGIILIPPRPAATLEDAVPKFWQPVDPAAAGSVVSPERPSLSLNLHAHTAMPNNPPRLRYIRIVLLLVFIGWSIPRVAVAQDDQSTSPSWLLFVGSSNDRYDFGETHVRGHSMSLRGGVRLPAVDVSVIAEHWLSWGDRRVTSALVEASCFPFVERTVSPYMLLGFGYGRHELPDAGPSRPDAHGSSATFGAGVQAKMFASSALRAEAVVRDEMGTFSSQLRLSVGYAGEQPRTTSELPAAGAELALYGMAPLRGPWRFVEPGYVLRYTRPYGERISGSLAMGVYHWQATGSGLDTRAFVGMPGVQVRMFGSELLTLRGGPAIIAMGEGPDGRANLGGHLELATKVRPFSVPLAFGVGTLWMSRNPEAGSHLGSEDQLGLSFFGGLHF